MIISQLIEYADYVYSCEWAMCLILIGLLLAILDTPFLFFRLCRYVDKI